MSTRTYRFAAAMVAMIAVSACGAQEPSVKIEVPPHDGEPAWWTSVFVESAPVEVADSIPDIDSSDEPTDPPVERLPVLVRVPGDVLFASGEATFGPDAAGAIDEMADIVRSAPNSYTYTCHTDSLGTDDENDSLSRERAATLQSELAVRGIIVEVEGRGEREPIATNDTETDRTLNRRCQAELT